MATALRGNRSAGYYLARHYYVLSIDQANRRLLEEPATKALYWASASSRQDANPDRRAEMAKMEKMLLEFAPQLAALAQEYSMTLKQQAGAAK